MSAAPTSVLGQISSLSLSASNITVQTAGTTRLTVDSNGNANFAGPLKVSNQTVSRNRIINGDMRVDQRYAGSAPVCLGNTAASAAASAYTADRWQATTGAASGLLAAQQVPLSAADQASIGGVSTKAVAITPAVAPSLTTGLTTLVTFEGSNAVDTLGGMTGPTWTGTPAYTTGKIGSNCMDLSANGAGSSSPAVYASYSVALTVPLTVSFWAYAFTPVGASDIQMLLCFAGPTYWGYQVNLNTTGTIQVDSWFTSMINSATTSILPQNIWTHVCVTLASGGNSTIYLNGVSAASVAAGTGSLNSYSNGGVISRLVVGGYYASGAVSRAFKGYIDDLRIYNRVLTPSDITALYNYNGSTIPMQVSSSLLSGLMAYVPFEGGSVQDVMGALTAPTWTGTPAFTTGKVGSTALNLSGNTAAATATQCVINTFNATLNTFSVSFWMYVIAFPASNYSVPISFGSGTTGNAGGGTTYDFVIGGSGIIYTDLEIYPNDYYTPLAGNGSVSTGMWYHVCGTVSTGTTNGSVIYINGAFYTQATVGDGSIPITNVNFGCRPDKTFAFNGYIDDVRIYNRVLTTSEIAKLATNTPTLPIPNTLAIPQTASTTGLLSYYPFESVAAPTSGLTSLFSFDNTITDAQGTLSSSFTGTAQYVSGKVGTNAVYFANDSNIVSSMSATHGPNYVVAPFTQTTPLSIAFWMNFTKLPVSTTCYSEIVSLGSTSATFEGLTFIGNSNGFYLAINASANYTATYLFSVSQWYHVVLVFIPNLAIQLWVNGSLFSSVACTQSSITAAGTCVLSIGEASCTSGAINRPFAGYIDDFRIYNRAISANEVSQIAGNLYDYQGTLPITTSGLTTQLTFDSTTADSQGTLSAPATTGSIVYNTGLHKVGTGCLDLTANPVFGTPNTYITYPCSAPGMNCTISTWINVSSITGAGQQVVYCFGGSSAGAGYSHALAINNNASGQIYTQMPIGVVGSSVTDYGINSTVNAVVGTWMHVANVINQSTGTYTIYVNGVAAGSNTSIPTSGVVILSADKTAIAGIKFGGTYINTTTNSFKGYIDDFRIYNRALSVAEIAALAGYANPLAPTGTPQYVGGRVGSQALYLANEANVIATPTKASNYASISSIDVATTSVSGWFYYTKMPLSGNISTLWSFGSGTLSESFNLFTRYISLTQGIVIPSDTNGSAGNTNGTIVNINTWYHIAVVLVPSTSNSLYVNGLLINKNTTNIGASATSQKFLIGESAATSLNRPFAGYIDDLRIYNRALSASDVAGLFYAGQSSAYALYQQPIEGQAVADLALGTSAASSMAVSAWLKNNTASAQSFSLALNGANPGLTTWIPFESGSAADVMGGVTGPVVTGNVSSILTTSTYKVGNTSANFTANTIGNYSSTTGTSSALTYSIPALSTPFTISGWINTPSTAYIQVPISLGSRESPSTSWGLQMVISASAQVYVDCTLGGTVYTAAASAATAIQANMWFHYTSTVTSSGFNILYINGQQVSSIATGSSVNITSQNSTNINQLSLGARTGQYVSFNGYIDDVRIYNTALSAAQILQLYQNNASSTTLQSYLLPRSVIYQTPSIPAASWQKLSFAVPGDLLGTYPTDNSRALTLALCLGAGSAVSSSTSNVWQNALVYNASNVQVFGASSNNFLASPYNSVLLTGVQLEKGTASTVFESQPLATQLSACRRYYEKSYNQSDALGTLSANGAATWSVVANNRPSSGVFYKNVKRAVPTLTAYNPSTGMSGSAQNVRAAASGPVTFERSGDASFSAYWPSTNTGQTLGDVIQMHYVADAEI